MNEEESKEYQKFKEQCMTMNFLYLTEKYFYCDKENKELHNKIDKAIEILSKINFDDENEWIPPKEIKPVFIVLKDSDVDDNGDMERH